jgi:hypothetical protein
MVSLMFPWQTATKYIFFAKNINILETLHDQNNASPLRHRMVIWMNGTRIPTKNNECPSYVYNIHRTDQNKPVTRLMRLEASMIKTIAEMVNFGMTMNRAAHRDILMLYESMSSIPSSQEECA